MKAIGFGGSGHDWSVCLIDEGHIRTAIDEERLTRLKYGLGSNLLTSLARMECLESNGIAPSDIDYAVACDLVPLPLAAPFRRRLTRIRHHLAHANSAFFASPFDHAAVLIADNGGSLVRGPDGFHGAQRFIETISFWRGRGRVIECLGDIVGNHVLHVSSASDYYHQIGDTDNSLGHLYWIASVELGFQVIDSTTGGVVSEDGKTMGLAAYGDNRYVEDLSQHLRLLDDGRIALNLTDGGFREHLRTLINGKSHVTIGEDFRRWASVAKAVQTMLENALIHIASYLRKRTGEPYLAMAGGVMLNCLATTRIAREVGFDDVFVFPAAADNGNAVGAAVYGLVELGHYTGPLDIYGQLPFLGPQYDILAYARAIRYILEHGGAIVAQDDLIAFTAAELARGKIIAWYEGRSEFGPRALGHRSIIADPRGGDMQSHINEVVKRREAFRPFAPMVLEERVHDYFDIPDVAALPFMTMIGDVKPEHRSQLPAITHVDGTARVQTISSRRYPTLHRLLKAFEQQTGLPVLLNTSFNRAGEPIVETPMNAAECFLDTNIDYLVLEETILTRA